MANNLITGDLRGAKGLRRALEPAVVLREVQKAIETTAKVAQRTAKGEVPRDTGALGRAIALETQPLQAKVFINRPVVFALVMELGRRKGAPMPPPAKLSAWARRHGIPTDRGTLFVLARAIGRRGIKGRFFMRAGRRVAKQRIDVEIQRAGRRVDAEWRKRSREGGP